MALDPEILEKWQGESMENVFIQQFSLQEKLKSNLSGAAAMGENAHFDARQSLVCVAKMIDAGVTRGLVQTDDDNQALVIDIFSHKGTSIFKRSDNPDLPMILARVAYHNLNNEAESEASLLRMMCVQAIGKTMPKAPKGVQSIKAGCPEEMTILCKFLTKNSRLLPKKFVASFEKSIPQEFLDIPNSFTTFLSPLYTGKFDRTCTFCGLFGKQSYCSRCELVCYCSRQCQKEDWKRHKAEECFNSAKLHVDKGNYVEIDPMKCSEKKRFASAIGHHDSCGSMRQNTVIVDQRTAIRNLPIGEFRVMKVQVGIDVSASENADIVIYPKGKKLLLYANNVMFRNGAEDYKKLFMLCKEKGDDCGYGSGGLKIFLFGARTSNDKLQLRLDKVLPLQRW